MKIVKNCEACRIMICEAYRITAAAVTASDSLLNKILNMTLNKA